MPTRSDNAEAFWRALVDALPEEVAVVDRQGVIVAANSAWIGSAEPICDGLEHVGFQHNLMEALRSRVAADSADARRLLAGIEAVLAGERREFHLDYKPGKAPQGRWFALEARQMPLEPLALLLCRRDITTERGSFATALQESEQRARRRSAELQAILDAAPIGLSIAQSASGDHIRGNPALERMFGVPAGGEFSKVASQSVDLRLFQSGRELSVAELPMQRAVRGETVPGQIYDILCPDGRVVTALATARPILDESGKPRGAVGAFMDFTQIRRAEEALRESEQRFRSLVEAYAQAVWETDETGAIVSDSPTWRASTGQTLEELLGDGWLNAVHPEDRADARRRWRDAVAARGKFDAESRLQDRAGGWRWTNLRATPTLNSDGTVRRWLGMSVDIDARKRAEAALRASEERYRESEFRLQLALDSGNIGIYEWRLDTGELIWDDRLRAQWGLSPWSVRLSHFSLKAFIQTIGRGFGPGSTAPSIRRRAGACRLNTV
ncbi:PAS domain-containing protein [Methylocystis sp. IM2]|uniref:PAS domain-containing protein n=1 Tax=Methylocystis sp. IM4 TaxID=3136560 RepID=UPI0030FA493E